jgi:site-specific recombinase XerD
MQVILKPLYHRQQECIGIYFEKNAIIQKAIQKGAGAKWSKTHTCWYVPLSKNDYGKLSKVLKTNGDIKNDELREYLLQKKDRKATTISGDQKPAAILPRQNIKARAPGQSGMVSKENLDEFSEYKNRLLLKGYSSSTVRTYCNEFHIFLQSLKNHKAKELTPPQLQRYILYCIDTLKLSENTVHSRMNALKFYYEQILHKEKMFFEIPRPKKPLLLPKLLNETELRKLFNALTNKKHKAMLFTAYSAGLRVSEVANLKIADIDSQRMQIFIERAKGKKDRYVNLSPILLDILRNYHKEYVPKPKVYLFESEQTFSAYPARTIQQIFSNAKNKAGIKKDVGIHSLRHSFATHLLDKGTDIKFIKDLLGHFNIKTTEIYLHVSKEKLVNIISPFDDLWKKESLDW